MTPPRVWTRLVLAGARASEAEERLGARLEEMGTLGWEVREREILAYFAAPPDVADLAREFPDLASRLEEVGEEAWAEAHRAHFPPGRVGPFLVSPPWNTPLPGSGETTLVIDPGLAFGTGTHPTTRACLSFVARHAGPDARVLDVGTGSGLLALAAARRGAIVTAVDTDPDAVREAEKAFVAHGFGAGAIDLRKGGLDAVAPSARFDLVTANLTGETLLSLAFVLPPRLRPNGVLVLAGILLAEEERIHRAFAKRLALESILREGEWVAMSFRAPA